MLNLIYILRKLLWTGASAKLVELKIVLQSTKKTAKLVSTIAVLDLDKTIHLSAEDHLKGFVE